MIVNSSSISVVVEGPQIAYLQVLWYSCGIKKGFELIVCSEDMVTWREKQFSNFKNERLISRFFVYIQGKFLYPKPRICIKLISIV